MWSLLLNTVWVGWPSLKKWKHNISQATRAEWVSWPSLRSGSTFSYIVIYFIYMISFVQGRVSQLTISEKWQDIFIYCDIFHIWYILTRAEWVGWPSLRSGRTFAEAPTPLHLNIHRHLFEKVFFIFIFVLISHHQDLRNVKSNNRLVWN